MSKQTMNNKNMCLTAQYTNQFINLLCSLFIVGFLLFPQLSVAADVASWQDISNKVNSTKSNAIRSRRNPDATVIVQITNTSGSDLVGPFRLVITDLDPNTGGVDISNETGVTASGEPYFDLAPYVGETFIAGATSDRVSVKVAGGGRNLFAFNVRVEQEIVNTPEPVALSVKLTSPATLGTVGASPLAVQGTISDPEATLTLNGVSIVHSNGSFAANVALAEGHNTVLARAVSSDGKETTDSISIALDTTPPYITVESPVDGSTVNVASIAVSGLVNDIVRGTVSAEQAAVVVNGKTATVENRSYLAENIGLKEGENTITVTGSDQQGNTASKTITVTYAIPKAKRIELVSGQNQTAKILSVLPLPLKVKLVDGNGDPVADNNVVYRVIQGDGVAGAGSDDEGQGVLTKTNQEGIASVNFKLGSRSGQGNHRVRAKAVGFDGEVVFYASAETNPGNKVSVNSGNNQRGAPNQSLPQPLIVAVTDVGANLVQGAKVEFKVTKGGGKFQNGNVTYIATTDSDGRATASLTLGETVGLDVQRVSATLVGTTLNAGFTASALQPADPGLTSITGLVLDNQDNPLPKVTIRIEGSNRQAETDAQGKFKITEAPVGPVHLIVDGSTTTNEGEWPTLSYNLVTIAGAENPLSAPVYMVKLDTENSVYVGKEDKVLTLKEVPGFKLEVKKDSVTFPDGAREGFLSVTPVNANKIPMAPPNGMQPQFIVTIQPSGAKFDPPAPLTLPNVDGHLPGAQVEMYSYDHDLEEFVTIGLGTVTSDGSLIKSNVGVGVIKAGWHCGSQPGGSGCANSCAECEECDGDCNCIKLPNVDDNPGDCKKPKDCKTSQPDNSDKPDDQCKECVNGEVKAIVYSDTIEKTEISFGMPSETVTKINDGLEELEKIGILASVSLLQVTGQLTTQDCCKSENGRGKNISGSVNGKFGEVSIKGKIWPPGPIPSFGPKTISVFGLASLEVSAKFVGGVFLGIKGEVTGEVGRKKEECSSNPADVEGCFFGELKTSITTSLSAEVGGEGKLVTDCIFCAKETIVLAGSLILGEASWSFDISNVNYNTASCSSGLAGGTFQSGPGKFKMAAKFSGSYQTNDGVVTKVEREFSFLSCEITLAKGVVCKSVLF